MESVEIGLSEEMSPERSSFELQGMTLNIPFLSFMVILVYLLRRCKSETIIPRKFLENYQLITRMTLEYRRECSGTDVVESLCKPGEESFAERHQDKNVDSLASALFQDGDHRKSYTHLLQTTGDKESADG
ncbi:ACYL-[ACYL-CARRIER-PROTEIN] HYDROLASE [Salix purpurea]|uniref:ACYL-[ACYL-CARRIER-PROTEIN] HYDROLASE n=1 Tax=Salix purpurea TaxID=77065 RepID=A0A9Q0VIQ3_SALPP|nr:ACYL-[ACYL-CARRIER-PROTEIN] HYDROLASE [Salix purpurea]